MNHRMEYDISEGVRLLALAKGDNNVAAANEAWDKWFDWSFHHAEYIMDSLTALRALHEIMAARATLVLTYDDEDHEYALAGLKSHGKPREWTGSRLEHVLRNAADDLAKPKPRDLSKWLLKREGISLSREEIWALAYRHLSLQDQWLLGSYEHGIHVQELADLTNVHISAIYRRLEHVAKVLYRVSVGGAR